MTIIKLMKFIQLPFAELQLNQTLMKIKSRENITPQRIYATNFVCKVTLQK